MYRLGLRTYLGFLLQSFVELVYPVVGLVEVGSVPSVKGKGAQITAEAKPWLPLAVNQGAGIIHLGSSCLVL